jgi:hypothetical protein
LFGLAGLAVVVIAARDSAGWLYEGGFLVVAVLAVLVVVAAADDRSTTPGCCHGSPCAASALSRTACISGTGRCTSR